MTNYIIDDDGFRFRPLHNDIVLSLPHSECLTEQEIIKYTIDSLEHEHIHKALFNLFNHTTSALFDGISYLISKTYNIEKKYLKYKSKIDGIKYFVYVDDIKKFGYKKAIIEYYQISEFELLDTNNLTNNKLLADENYNTYKEYLKNN